MTVPHVFAIGSAEWPGLSKLTEESGEVCQVIGKLMGTGGEVEHWDGTNLRDRLIEEMGDALAAIVYVGRANDFLGDVELRAAKKLALFLRWHTDVQLTLNEKSDTLQGS